jgi:hypothetical protein
VRKNSAGSTFLRRRLNLIEGTDLTITAADDSVDEEVDITLGLSATVNSNARVGVRKNSAGSTFLRRRLNLIEGGGITLTVSDDSGDEEVDVTIATSGGGSGVVSDIYVNGVLIGTRSIVEFLNGANFTVSGTDTGTRVQVTGAASVTGVAGLSMFNHLGLG